MGCGEPTRDGLRSSRWMRLPEVESHQDSREAVEDRIGVCRPLETAVLEGKLARVVSWYDNEWGFSNRMIDTAGVMAGLI